MTYRNDRQAALARLASLEDENERLHNALAEVLAKRQRRAFAGVSPDIAAITIEAMNALADALTEEGRRAAADVAQRRARTEDYDHDAVLRRIALLEAENEALGEDVSSGVALRVPQRGVPAEISVPAVAAAIALGRRGI